MIPYVVILILFYSRVCALYVFKNPQYKITLMLRITLNTAIQSLDKRTHKRIIHIVYSL